LTPDRFRSMVSGILLLGVTASAILVACGLAGSFLVGWTGSLSGAPDSPLATTDFSAMGASLAVLRPVGIAQLGLVVLLATPVTRVAASCVGFLLEGDRLYAAITAVVLGVLLVSLFALR
jgi:uncharacterized membrane protein